MADLWQVTLVSPPYEAWTYGRPSHFPPLSPGQRVIIPFGKSHRAGIVVGPAECAPKGVEIKNMIWPLEPEPLLDADFVDMAVNLARRQMVNVGRILEIALPRGLRTAAVSFAVDRHMTERDLPATARPSDLARAGDRDRAAFLRLWLDGRMRVRVNAQKEAEERFVTLLSDPPWAVRPNAKRQLRLLEHLMENGPQSLYSLRCTLGDWTGGVAVKLESAGIVTLGELTADRLAEIDGAGSAGGDDPGCAFELTGEQRTALDEMTATLDAGGGAHLVHGVTGSGKTVLYMEMALRLLERGRSVLFLAPEVALACQLYRTVARRFPQFRTLFYHGYQSPKKREGTFRELAGGDGPVLVVGTRSAVFLPLPDLGLVVMDEEHDESFKQEDRLAYHAKEVAWFRAARAKGLLLLGSATPDVKTFHAAAQGLIRVSTLRERVGDSQLPEVELVDISALEPKHKSLSPKVREALLETVKAGEQVIVMLNRRGYAPIMYCLDCTETVRCPDCEVGMTYHKGRERLVCHYCGRSYAWPLTCRKCGGSNFVPMGEGTEQLEEVLEELLPEGTGVLRLDRDATRRQERLEEILGAFGRGEAQVLVGTQMISKGHHFPGVTLVVVADGDLGLNLPDYRSSERTFQLLVQVAGRAGRGDDPGRVLIQTRNPNHPIWKEILGGDYPGFFEREVSRRTVFRYPPFSRMALVRISYPADLENGPVAVGILGEVLREQGRALDIAVLGPAPAPLAMLRGRKRFNCLLKSDDWGKVRTLYAAMARSNPDPRNVRTGLDLDPLSTL
ncbi:replication restart DNA helicase PriA [Pseudodesulfovibrio indicus]|uniref:Replication restart protein PriA n=1 Tax=Pseudodesulfovibrio indicus TaxID=1716143 RepID=A0AA94TJL0_9BACT|nr:primosomal protein N' [Pseudodesulfovibrio indicus]TDT89797.1 replication restart DNA helicase PriA [Pseudodesulfovibrio indicus]